MPFKYLLLFTFFLCSAIDIDAKPNENNQDRITVYIFLHESCIISQYYTLPLREMYQEYANENIQFIGLFPNFSSKPDKIEAFKKDYKIPFELKSDYYHTKKNNFGATVTPEVVVYNESKKQIVYKGRIDDTYARVGQKRRITSTSELKDVLQALTTNKAISISNTEAIGCFIGKSKLN